MDAEDTLWLVGYSPTGSTRGGQHPSMLHEKGKEIHRRRQECRGTSHVLRRCVLDSRKFISPSGNINSGRSVLSARFEVFCIDVLDIGVLRVPPLLRFLLCFLSLLFTISLTLRQ